MGQRFVACDREQSFLMPPDVREWLPPRHLAWFVIDAVAEMDLDAFYAAYRVDGRSRPPYDPAMMVALLLYAYARGIRSSRVIERACEEDVAFRVLAAQQRPDHATIARFVERHQDAIAGLFGEVLTLCARSGLAKVGVIAVDGTKVQANASRNENLDYEQLAREILEEAKAVDAAEDELYGEARGDELPPEFATAQGRRGWLREAKQRLEAERAANPQPVPRSRPKRAQGGQAPPRGGAVDRGARQPGLRGLPGARADEGRPALRPADRTPTAAGHAGGAHQRHRSRLTRRQGPARVHPGLQRPGRHQRASGRAGRRGDDRRRRTSGTSSRCSTPPSANCTPPASTTRPGCCWPTPATGTSEQMERIIDRGHPGADPARRQQAQGRPAAAGTAATTRSCAASWPASTAASFTANASR